MEAIGEGEAEVVDVADRRRGGRPGCRAARGLEVKLDVEPDLGAEGDPVLLRQVLIGLLTNAFKHTPAPGTVTLRARRKRRRRAVIEVSDTGTGIPAEERDRVFERFYSGSDALRRRASASAFRSRSGWSSVMGGEIGVELGGRTRAAPSGFGCRSHKPAPTPVA